MLFSFVAMAGAFALVFRGVEVLGCQSVSLSRSIATCYANDFGALSGSTAGGGLIVLGAVVFLGAMIRFARVR